MTIWNMFLIFLLAGTMTSYAVSFIDQYRISDTEGAYYIFYKSPDNMGVKAFGSFYLLLNQFIPYELLIIIEMVKIHYTMFIENDWKFYNVEGVNRLLVQNLSMHEELG
jgi:magnesium-transporting ATPase (P-type)